MSFLSMNFFVLFLIFIILYHLSVQRKHALLFQQILILLANIVFYSFADIRFIPFLIYIIVVTWIGGLYSKNKLGLSFFIVIDVLPLIFFKYVPTFFHPNIIFPLGLSFFTFQSISYIVECYKKKIIFEKNILIVANFISFFPVISSGPIQRSENLIPQLKTIHYFNYNNASDGLKLFAWGIFKKLCIADKIAMYVDFVYRNSNEQLGVTILFATILYSFQIYCDFSGYSDMAIGIMKYMGFEVGKNFDHPYLSKSIGEFWRRWHISLSSWLRDYIYIPLGGSRVSYVRIYINLIITFLVSGIWHGSTWNFIIWGLLHGVFQCIERINKNAFEQIKIHSCLKIVFTFCLVTFAWIFFRTDNLQQAFFVIKKISGVASELVKMPVTIKQTGIIQFARTNLALDVFGSLYKILDLMICFFIFCSISIYTRNKDGLTVIRTKSIILRWILYIGLCSIVLPELVTNTNTQFLYFSF